MKQAFALVSVVLLLVGCRSTGWDGSGDSSTLRLDKISAVGVVSGATDDAMATIKIEYERPVDSALASFVDGFVAESYGNATGDVVGESGMDAVRRTFEMEYDESGRKADWQLNVAGTLVYFDSLFASYRVTFFTYFGGVHPDVWIGNVTYDRHAGRRIVLADLFDETSRVEVIKIIRRKIAEDETRSEYLREKCACEDGCDVVVSENFMIVQCGLVWTYNEYEISGYGEGCTDVFVSWDEIGDCLREHAPTPITVPAGVIR